MTRRKVPATDAIRDALAKRDVSEVYRLLVKAGWSQREIADRTGQPQSGVSEVIHGRTITHYDLLVQVADGLGVPRGWMGLRSDFPSVEPNSDDAEPDDTEEAMRRRDLLALAAAVAIGADTLPRNPYAGGPTDRLSALDNPKHVGLSDIEYLSALKQQLWTLDETFGAMGQNDATLGLWRKATSLLKADMTDYTRSKLLSLCANIGAHVSWSTADTGDNPAAQFYADRAIRFASQAGDFLQTARILSYAARSELQFGDPGHALKLFQFGDLAADRAGSDLLGATLKIHGSQAAAVTGFPDTARNMAAAADDQYRAVTSADPVNPYPYGDIASARAAVYYALGEHDAAVTDMGTATDQAETHRVRSLAFRAARLSLFRLGAGDTEGGIEAGHQAVDAAGKVRSARVLGRLAPVADAAQRTGTADGRALAREVRRTVSAGA